METNWKVEQEELCECGHTKFMHSLSSEEWIPSWSGCLGGCLLGACTSFRKKVILESEIKDCKACKARLGNRGIPKIYPMSEADSGQIGDYYKVHVRCEQCGVRVLGDKSNISAIEAWNSENS